MSEWLIQSADSFSRVVKEVPELRYAGDDVLRKEAKKVSVSEGKKIGQKLGEVLLKYRKITGVGRGLAAPQIGISKAVFVTFVHDKLQPYINPEITERSEETNLYRERCISSGIVSVDVRRSESIKMKWVDEKNVLHHEKFSDFMARLIQHEVAHLGGTLNLDEAVPGTLEVVNSDPLKEKLRKG